MVALIALRECKDLILSLRFYLAFLLCALPMLSGAWVLGQEQGRQKEHLGPFLQEGQYRQVLEWASAHALMNGGLFLTRPLPELRSLVRGLEDLSLVAQVKGANQVLYMRAPLVDNSVHRLFFSFDLVFVAGALLSLVALAFTCDAVAGEREEGTLRLLLSQPVSRAQVLAGKGLGAWAALLALFAPCFLGAVLVAGSQPLVDLWSAWPRLLALFAVCLLYAGVFAGLGLLVSCRAQGAGAAMVRGLGAWVLLVWVLPAFAPFAGAWLAGGTSPMVVEASTNAVRREAEEQGWARMQAFIGERGWGDRKAAGWNLEWGTWSDAVPGLAAELEGEEQRALLDFSTRVMREQLRAMEEQALQVQAEHGRQWRGQVEAGRVLACLSPMAPLVFLLTDLSGTGVGEELRFRGAVEEFKGELVGYLYGEMGKRNMWEKVGEQAFPVFAYEGGRGAGAEVLAHAGLLVLYGVLFFAGAYWVFARDEI